MFKKLKFIEGVKLDLDGQVEYVGNKKPALIEDGSYLHLFISGGWRTYSRSWLGLIAHYEYDLGADTKTEFLSITNATKVFWSGKGNAPAKKWLHGRFVPRVYKDRYVIIEDGEDIVDVVREARETKDIRITGPYQALNIETMEVLESTASRELGENVVYLNLSLSMD